MKKSKKICLIVVAAAVLAAAAAFAWFRSPGVHFLGPFGRIALTETGYLYDLDDQEGESATVQIQGSVSRDFPSFQTGVFTGVVTVDAVDSKGDSQGVNSHPFLSREEGAYQIIYYDSWFTYNEDEQSLSPSFDGYQFSVYGNADGSFALVARYLQEGTSQYRFAVIQADSRYAADTQYSQMKESGLIP